MNRLCRGLYFGIAVLGALMFGRAAHAGNYSVVYSDLGGTITNSNAGGASWDYTTVPQQSWGGQTSTGGPSASASCSGQITATFTWVADPSIPNDTAPPQGTVIISEQCTATGSGNGYGIAVTVTDDLGDAQQGSTNGPAASYTSTGYRYTVHGGSTFTTQCSPSATTSCPNGGVGVNVKYTATAYPVSILLAGGITVDSVHRYLIGQHCTASVFDSGFAFGPSAYTWSVPGGAPFAGFTTVDTPQDFSPYAKSVLTALTVTTASSLSCYFATQDTVTISCQVTFTLPNTTMTVTPSIQLATDVPTANVSISVGTTQQVGNTDGGSVGLHGAENPLPATLADSGIFWSGTVVTPAAYAGGGGSTWGVVQLVSDTLQRTSSGVTQKIYWTPIDGTPDAVATTLGLDDAYPYSPWFTCGPTVEGNGDTPDVIFHGTYDYSGGNSFSDWVMYVPPGDDSMAVPIGKFTWSWSQTSAPSGAPPNVTWTSTNLTQDHTDPVSAFNDWPSWEKRYGTVNNPNTSFKDVH